MTYNRYSKENIKSRIYKIASNFWNIPKIEGLDPIVKLIIEAVSEEIYSLSTDAQSIESRLLEKLANILTPDILTAPAPAHAILHARPAEPEYNISGECMFRYENPSFLKRNHLLNLSFVPVCCSRLRDAGVRYLIASGVLCSFDKSMNKQLLSRPKQSYTEGNRVWLALEVNPLIHSLNELTFFIDFPGNTNRQELLSLLPYSEWRINGSKLNMVHGMSLNEKDNVGSPFAPYELENRIDQKIIKIYNNHFLTIKQDVVAKNTSSPDFLDLLYNQEIINNLKDLTWISIDFPPNFTPQITNDLFIAVNAIPVANKNKYHLESRVENILGIIPLITENSENFLAVESVNDASGKKYLEVSYNISDTSETGTYAIKKGGCERFDSRDAKDYLNRLTDLLNDECAAFSYNSRGKLLDAVQQMEILITQMNQLSDSNNGFKEIPSYILIEGLQKKEYFEVDYWITNCELANNLKSGTSLNAYSSQGFDPKNTVLLTPTYGGKREPVASEKANMYKYILTTNDRIVTIHDIINFCRMEMGDLLSDIEVKKGVAVSNIPKEGLIRTTDIFIKLQPVLNDSTDYANLGGNLKNKLLEKSPDTYNYRVFINN
jgi:hypothetical protein